MSGDSLLASLPLESRIRHKAGVTVSATSLMASADHGATWTPIGDPLPFKVNGVTYSAFRNAFFVWQWDCMNAVLPNAIMRFGYDYRK